jgi:hypothetical protein
MSAVSDREARRRSRSEEALEAVPGLSFPPSRVNPPNQRPAREVEIGRTGDAAAVGVEDEGAVVGAAEGEADEDGVVGGLAGAVLDVEVEADGRLDSVAVDALGADLVTWSGTPLLLESHRFRTSERLHDREGSWPPHPLGRAVRGASLVPRIRREEPLDISPRFPSGGLALHPLVEDRACISHYVVGACVPRGNRSPERGLVLA